MAAGRPCNDGVLLNDWHVVADRIALDERSILSTRLLGVDLSVRAERGGAASIVRTDTGAPVLSDERYGFVWACLGSPERQILDIPEAAEEDRYRLSGGSIRVQVSGLRAVENFLDMGHFPFVHTGWLGIEPHTEVTPYKVDITDDGEVLATECKFFQPVA